MTIGPQSRFVIRLALMQASVPLLSTGLTLVLAPRALLLDPIDLSLGVGSWAGVAIFISLVQTMVTVLLTRPLTATLFELYHRDQEDSHSGAVDAHSLARLDALPARLVMCLMAVSTTASLATALPALRPPTHDATTQGTLALFHFAVIAAAALPLYVLLRSSVATVLELAPSWVAEEAIENENSPSRALTRVRTRFLLAVAAPVGFIALGASLLAYAHVRAAAEEAQRATAEVLAKGVLDAVSGSTVGRDQAISAAAGFGILVDITRATDKKGPVDIAQNGDESKSVVVVPLEDGIATIRVPRQGLTRTLAYALVVVVAALATALLGARIGGLYSKDLAVAKNTIDQAGALEFMTGRYFPVEPRFSSVEKLHLAIGDLGLRFRVFAGAQERAIVAKEAAERMRALFLAAMSHDLKAPLNSILGFATLVERSPLTAEQHQSLAIIQQRGRELLRLIETILDAARAEAGQLELSVEESKMGDVVMSAVLDAREQLDGSEVKIIAEVQPNMPSIHLDTQRMVQALFGVIATAVRLTERGFVTVRATIGANVAIDVETAGRVLDPGEREKIFDAFQYPDRARRLGSLGLELSLARAIVELHRGKIHVDEPTGSGIAFHVRLPIMDIPLSSIPRRSQRPPRVS